MQKENWVKQQLLAGEPVFPLWAESISPTIVEAAVCAGWKVILIDNEHGAASLETTVHMVRAVECAGGHAIVRVPWNDPVYLKRILDLGVQSIMLPMIVDEASASQAVASCRYPKRGQRGYAAPIVRASGYGAFETYAADAHEHLLLIAQIEHIDAKDNITEIAGVDGIDMLFIGPNDLAGSMGHLENLVHNEVNEAVRVIEDAIKKSGKMMGCMSLPGVSCADELKKGHKLVANHGDMGIFVQAARQALETLPK